MKINDLIEDFQYLRTLQAWEKKRPQIEAIERQFRAYTGLLDVGEYHFNHAHTPSLKKALKIANNHKGKRILVSGGDAANLDTWSRYYNRTPENTDPEYEIQTLISYLRLASLVYDHIVFLTTNHENRLRKIIEHCITDKHVAGSVKKRVKTLMDDFKSAGLNKVIFIDDYVFRVGDVFVTHFENNSNVPGSVGEKVMRGLNNLSDGTWKLAIQCHTHSQSKNLYQKQMVIESGTFQVSPDYWVNSGKIQGERKSAAIGYATCQLVNGKVDVNTADFKVLEWRKPVYSK